MIVRMNRVTLLCVASRRDETLEALRELGVLHLTHVKPPAAEDLDRARERLAHVRRALEVLPKRPHAAPSGGAPDEIVRDLWALIHRRHALEQEMDVLVYERRRLEPYGSFDPARVRALAEKGITVRLFHAARGAKPRIPADAVRAVLSETKDGTYFAVIGRGAFEVAGAAELRLPERSLETVVRRIAEVEKGLLETETGFHQHAGDHAVVARIVGEAEDRLRYLEARAGMGSAEPVAYLRGYCPRDRVAEVRSMAALEGWGLIVEDPAPGEAVPTLIRNPRWVRPIETVFQVFGILPAYEEIDVSAVFLVSLSLFSAMIIGDAAYGLIFLLATIWAQRKFPGVPARAFQFMKILSISTMAWGVLTGTYFSIHALPGPLRALKIGWLADDENLKFLCFLIGAVHLTIAHAWNTARMINNLRAIAQVGWICMTWFMFFAARTFVLGAAFPSWAWSFGIFGAVAIALFMTPIRELKTEWQGHVALIFTIVGNFTDVVSYIRLWAVGMATIQMASAFNSMALSGVKGVLSGALAALILFAGHALNIAMSLLAVMVHAVRLNVLEFSTHIGMQWSGFGYQPFSRRADVGTGGA